MKPRNPAEMVQRHNEYYQTINCSDVKYLPTNKKRSLTLFVTIPAKKRSDATPTKKNQKKSKSLQRKNLFSSLNSQKDLENKKFSSKIVQPNNQFLPGLKTVLNFQ